MDKPIYHRYINTILLVLTIAIGIILIDRMNHSLEDCEKQLFEKLTNKKAPTHEELCKGL